MRRRDDGGQRESEAIRRFILLKTQSGFQLIQQRQPRSSTPVARMRLWNLWIHERKTPQRNQTTFFRSLGSRNASQQTALFEEVNNFLQRTLNSSSSLAWSLFNRMYLSIVLGKAAYASKSTNLSSIYHCLLIIQFERCSKKYIYIQTRKNIFGEALWGRRGIHYYFCTETSQVLWFNRSSDPI